MNEKYARKNSWKAIRTGRVLVITWRDYPAYVVDSTLSADEGLEAFLSEHAETISSLTATIDLLVGAE